MSAEPNGSTFVEAAATKGRLLPPLFAISGPICLSQCRSATPRRMAPGPDCLRRTGQLNRLLHPPRSCVNCRAIAHGAAGGLIEVDAQQPTSLAPSATAVTAHRGPCRYVIGRGLRVPMEVTTRYRRP